MKPEAQRIAIGEYCHDHSQDRFTHWTDGEYLTDLNAMHEAEKMLTEEQKDAFRDELKEICLRDGLEDKSLSIHAIFSTAAQRAEAFLRTIGKWEE